jgi:D-alanyl-lipoteichoic acid acyltransferase DltB (MBOAT superfamily)
VAGPIERATRLLPQIENERVFSLDNVRSGFGLAMWGAFKKVVLADTLAPYVDKVFIHPEPEFPLIWAAAIAFSIQILADFSGYTDIARGTARMLGFDLVRNFDRPFMSTSTPEFWTRWHMSLSFWIRDYLMVPLLGTGKVIPFSRYIFATCVSFFLLAVWHGPTWNFMVLGVWHSSWVIIYQSVTPRVPEWAKAVRGGRYAAIAFHAMVPGLVGALLFREPFLSRIIQHFSQSPFDASREHWIAATVVLAITAAASAPLLLAMVIEDRLLPRLNKTVWYLPAQTGTWAAFAVAMYVFFRVTVRDFVYFAF